MLIGTRFRLCYSYVICVFCRLVVLVRLSVPVQVIDWKDVSEITYDVLMGTLNPAHSLTLLCQWFASPDALIVINLGACKCMVCGT